MTQSVVQQVLPYARFAVAYVGSKFNLRDGLAEDVVNDVLVSLLAKPSQVLSNPKRYLLRACRWRALQLHRNRARRKEVQPLYQLREEDTPEAPEVLIALEDEDKERFFGKATLAQRAVLELVHDGHSLVEISTILAVPASTIRMRLHLARKRLSHQAS